MQKVTLLFKCQPGKGQELLAALTAALVDTRAYDGCISVDTYVDADNPDVVMLFEEWESRAQNERYMGWRMETGLVDMLMPILGAPLEIYYFEPHPA